MAAAETSPLCPASVRPPQDDDDDAPPPVHVRRSHSLAVRSKEPVSSRSPAASHCSATTSPWWPARVCRQPPVSTSHRRTVASIDPVARSVPWGLSGLFVGKRVSVRNERMNPTS